MWALTAHFCPLRCFSLILCLICVRVHSGQTKQEVDYFTQEMTSQSTISVMTAEHWEGYTQDMTRLLFGPKPLHRIVVCIFFLHQIRKKRWAKLEMYYCKNQNVNISRLIILCLQRWIGGIIMSVSLDRIWVQLLITWPSKEVLYTVCKLPRVLFKVLEKTIVASVTMSQYFIVYDYMTVDISCH